MVQSKPVHSVCVKETILLCMSHYASGNANQYSWLITSWIQSCFPSHVSPCASGGQKHLQCIRHGHRELVLCLAGLFQIFVTLYLTIDLRERNIGHLLYVGQGRSGSKAYLRNTQPVNLPACCGEEWGRFSDCRHCKDGKYYQVAQPDHMTGMKWLQVSPW